MCLFQFIKRTLCCLEFQLGPSLPNVLHKHLLLCIKAPFYLSVRIYLCSGMLVSYMRMLMKYEFIQLIENLTQTLNLYRMYYVTMNIGNPAKPYYLDVDTGSDLTWLQCDAPCVSCSKVFLIPEISYKMVCLKLITVLSSLHKFPKLTSFSSLFSFPFLNSRLSYRN